MRKHLLKKVLSVALSLTLIGSAAAILPAALPESGIEASAATYGDFEYEVEDNEVTITGYNGSGGKVTIPSAINGKKVTSIGDSAFKDCASLTGITIPDSVTSIGDWAFDRCTSLTSVTIPNGVTSIGDGAFLNCFSLTSVTIPDSVTSIGDYAFEDCTSLTSVTIPDSVTSIGRYAFTRCTSLTSVTIPNGVTSIGRYAFYKCTSLTSVTIPDSVTSIGNEAFCGCTSLTSVTIPDSVTSIGDLAFSDCTSLTSVTIPDSVTSIGDKAFRGCKGLADKNGFVVVRNILYDYYGNDSEITIPDSVTSIGDEAFSGCKSLTSVTIPDSVTSIGEHAFADCTHLTSVTIPDSVTSIGGCAFAGCKSLTSVTIPDSVTSIGFWAFYNCTSLTSVTIPDSVTSIEENAFYYCTSLTSVTIPDSVTSIGEDAFDGCENVTIKGKAGSYAETYAAINNIPFKEIVPLSNTSKLSADSVILGKASGGTAPYTFNYLYKLSARNSWNSLSGGFVSETSKTFKPGKSGEYDIKVIAKDSNGKTSEKTFKLTVSDPPLVNRTKISATTIYQGGSVTITPTATGGKAPYTFTYYYKLTTKNSWNKFTGNTLKMGKTGAYDLRTVATDSTGATSEKKFIIKVKPASALENTSAVSASSIKTGGQLQINASATGGTAPYTYSYLYKLSTKGSWNKLSDGYVSDTSKSLKLGKTGEYDIKVIARDSAGKTSEKSFQVTAS